MTLVLIGKDLVLKGSTTKIEDKQVPGIYVNLYTSQFFGSKIGAAPTHPWTRKLSFRTPTCLPPRSFKRMPSGRLHNPWWLKPPPAPSFFPLRCINFWKNEEWRLWRVCIYMLTPIGESSYWDKISRSCIFYWRKLYIWGARICIQTFADQAYQVDVGSSLAAIAAVMTRGHWMQAFRKGWSQQNTFFCWDTV